MKSVKHILATFFITLMLLFKVAGLHALTHHADEVDVQHCEVCDIVTAVNFAPVLQTNHVVIANPQVVLSKQPAVKLLFNTCFSNRYLDSYLFTRPPPQLQ